VPNYKEFIFPGIIAQSMLFTAMFMGVTLIWDREFGFLKEVLVAPIPRTAIVLGKVLSGGAVTLLQGLMTVAFAPLVGVHISLSQGAALVAVIAALAVSFTALGVVLATRMRSFEGFGVISNFVVLPLYFLSGGVFPIDRLPTWMAVLVHVNPMTYGVDLMRSALGQGSHFPPGLDLAVIAAFGAAMVGLALALFRRE
jgi:ABC-2 type transport system permease protein